MTRKNLQNSSRQRPSTLTDNEFTPSLEYTYDRESARKPKKKFRLLKFFLGITLVLFVALILTKLFLLSRALISDTGLTPGTIEKLIFDSGVPLSQTDGRTNILILGIGGQGHTGSDLTDSMMILSLPGSGRSMALISVPRDVWSDTLQDKVNTAYHYGEDKKTGGGSGLAKVILHEETGLPIHYFVLVDFQGFEDIIDLVGGVDVVVPAAFTDPEYPILGKEADPCDGDPKYSCRYTSIHFDAGLAHMDGERALAYVRSRHADGEEGTDFARSKRQQVVLVALRDKLTKPDFWLDINRVKEALNVLKRTIKSDMNFGEMATVAKVVRNIGRENFRSISIENEFSVAPGWKYGGRYVLVPKVNPGHVKSFIQSELDKQ